MTDATLSAEDSVGINTIEDQTFIGEGGVRRWPAHSKYKDSGIPWISTVPEHWKTMRLKFSTYVKGRVGWHGLNSNEFLYEGDYYLVTGTDFIGRTINWETCYRITQERFEEDPYIHLREGDILVTKDGTIGKIAQVVDIPCKASVNSGVFVTRPLSGQSYDSDFMYYVLNSGVFYRFIDFQKTGTTISHLYQNVFENFQYCYPPDLVEQRAIANFLDRETARIDALIAKKQRLIELLQEKRTALISQAVTKGLDSNVSMKGSGVEWLDEIPAHWDASKIKYECVLIKDGTHLPPPRVEDGIPLLSVRNIIDGKFCLRDDDSMIAEEDYQSLARSFVVKKGDVVLAIVGATLGKVAIVEDMPLFHIQRSLGVFRVRESTLDNKFLRYFFESLPFQKNLWRSVGFSAQPGIYLRTLADICMLLPSLKEQELIVGTLEFDLERIDLLIRKVLAATEKLREYRTAIISTAVTGKIDVRQIGKHREIA